MIRYLLPILLLLLLIGCPKPDDDIICGQGMMLDAATCACIPNSHLADDEVSCECDSLYHWNDDISRCVLDTTSHNFTWSYEEIGGQGGQILDLALGQDDEIWVVGAFVQPDSDNFALGSWNYNIATWDGVDWIFSAIPHRQEVYSIQYFSDNDVWVTTIDYPYHWNGEEWTFYNLSEMGLPSAGLDCWGTSSTNMYFVGLNGGIVHYNGTSFSRIWYEPTNTIIDFEQVCGNGDGSQVFIFGQEKYTSPHPRTILYLSGSSLSTLYYHDTDSPGAHSYVTSIHMVNNRLAAKMRNGLLWYDSDLEDDDYYPISESDFPIDHIGTVSIAGESPNDMILTVGVGGFFHFNGESWFFDTQIRENYPALFLKKTIASDGVFYSVGSIATGQAGLLAIGRRN